MKSIQVAAKLLLVVSLMVSAECGITSQKSQKLGYAKNRVLVKLKGSSENSNTVSLQGVSSTQLSSRSGSLSRSRAYVYSITDGSSVEEKLKQLNARDDVEIAEPDYEVRSFISPNDPQYSLQWHLPKIKAPSAWDLSYGRRFVKVCLIDSGLRKDHPDLTENVLKGWNLVPLDQTTPGPAPTVGSALYSNYNDTTGHGTHVAGLVGALGNNTLGVSGTAWRVSLLPCRFIWDKGVGYISDAIKCMQLCRAEEAHIYSNSWGGLTEPSQILLTEIKEIEKANGLFVTAAGNENGLNLDYAPSYPASYNTTNIITVAATTQLDTLAGFSNYGKTAVHLAAPGEQIYSTTYDGSYGLMSGTSMSTPIVSGAAAVLQALAMSNGARLTPVQIRQLLMATVDPVTDGSSKLVSGGQLNLNKAVAKLQEALLASGSTPIASPSPTPTPSPTPPTDSTAGTNYLNQPLRSAGSVTIKNPGNSTHTYLAMATSGSITMSRNVFKWSRYTLSSGASLFKANSRWLSSNSGFCTKLASASTRTSAYRHFNMILVANSVPKARMLSSIGCSTSGAKYVTGKLTLSTNRASRVGWVITTVSSGKK